MSVGERSCHYFANDCPQLEGIEVLDIAYWSIRHCHVDCKDYKHDRKTEPDSVSRHFRPRPSKRKNQPILKPMKKRQPWR